MKINSVMSKFLKSKWVLNIVSILAFFYVIGLVVMSNLNALIFFIVIGFLVSNFSRNMIIILGIPLIVVNLLALNGTIREGMENNSTKNDIVKNNQKNDNNKKDAVVKKESLTNNRQEPKTGQGLQMSEVENASKENNAAQTDDGVGSNKGKNNGHKIDYATTVEEAYDNLNNILGGEGIQKLTADSQRLMKQQVQLAEAMKNMTPLIKSIEPMVQNLQGMMGQMEGKEGLGGIMDLAKKFMPSQSN
jgi:hypothetical protein